MIDCVSSSRLKFGITDSVNRRLEGVESEVQYLRRQLDEMRELLKQTRSTSTSTSQAFSSSPQQRRDRPDHNRRGSACTSSCSQLTTHPEEGFRALTAPKSTGITRDPQYPRELPGVSSNEISVPSLYEPSVEDSFRPNKRKRACFEIRDDAVADFIEKGLISAEYAYSCFNTCV